MLPTMRIPNNARPKSRLLLRSCLVISLLAAGPAGVASAAILWDYSPALFSGELAGPMVNQASSQNHAERILFSSDVWLTGMDVYTLPAFPSVGQSVTIRLWSMDVAGSPEGKPDQLLSNFTETVSIVDSDGIGSYSPRLMSRAYAAFTSPVHLSANTPYYIGMSGTSSELGQWLIGIGPLSPNVPDDGLHAGFIGLTNQTTSASGDVAFRLHGNSAVPEPMSLATWLGLVFCLLSRRLIMRRQSR